MNIFFVDRDPEQCARDHCDKHVTKMVLEYGQLLSTAHRVLDGDDAPDEVYQIAHKNHPSTIWAREYIIHYQWLYELWANLCEEFAVRYGKEHLTYTKLANHVKHPPKNIPVIHCSGCILTGPATDPPQCMPDEYKGEDTVEAYRKFYLGAKSEFAAWDHSPAPSWWYHQGHDEQSGVYDH